MFKWLFSGKSARDASEQSDTGAVEAETEEATLPPLERLREIREMMWDSSAFFSMSKTDVELDEIEQALDAAQDADIETRGELAYARAYLQARRGEDEATLENYTKALAAHDQTGFLPPKIAISARMGIGVAHEGLGDTQAALDNLLAALPEMQNAPDRNENQIGGVMEKIAFLLHELGRYDEALEMNLKLQDHAADLLPPDAPELCVMLINTAQNLHALGRPEEAKEHLERCLSIATQHNDHDRIVEMNFQLGVLAFEGGQIEAARALMTAAVDHADENGDDWLKDCAQVRLQELEDRVASET